MQIFFYTTLLSFLVGVGALAAVGKAEPFAPEPRRCLGLPSSGPLSAGSIDAAAGAAIEWVKKQAWAEAEAAAAVRNITRAWDSLRFREQAGAELRTEWAEFVRAELPALEGFGLAQVLSAPPHRHLREDVPTLTLAEREELSQFAASGEDWLLLLQAHPTATPPAQLADFALAHRARFVASHPTMAQTSEYVHAVERGGRLAASRDAVRELLLPAAPSAAEFLYFYGRGWLGPQPVGAWEDLEIFLERGPTVREGVVLLSELARRFDRLVGATADHELQQRHAELQVQARLSLLAAVRSPGDVARLVEGAGRWQEAVSFSAFVQQLVVAASSPDLEEPERVLVIGPVSGWISNPKIPFAPGARENMAQTLLNAVSTRRELKEFQVPPRQLRSSQMRQVLLAHQAQNPQVYRLPRLCRSWLLYWF